MVAALIGGLIGAFIVHFTWSSDSGSAGACPATSVADQVLPSVVTISATADRGQGAGTGSGEIIRSDGYILTNNHVISMAANGGSVEVLLSDDRSYPATIVGRDPQTDLAVLKATDLQSPQVIGIGFAIPVALAKLVSDEIISTGSVSHAFLGLQAAPISASVAQQAGVTEGLYVNRVTGGGPSADAGLRVGT